MLCELLLAVTVSVDTMLAAAAYSGSGIRIPMRSAAVINAAGAAVLGLSLLLSDLLCGFISPEICRIAGFAVLTSIGTANVLKSLTRNAVRRFAGRELRLSAAGLMIRLYLDDTAADCDCSKSLSVREAAALAAASSLDSAATGLSSGICGIRPLYAVLFTFTVGTVAFFLGNKAGRKISSLPMDLSWTGGLFLILFAFLSYFKNLST